MKAHLSAKLVYFKKDACFETHEEAYTVLESIMERQDFDTAYQLVHYFEKQRYADFKFKVLMKFSNKVCLCLRLMVGVVASDIKGDAYCCCEEYI